MKRDYSRSRTIDPAEVESYFAKARDTKALRRMIRGDAGNVETSPEFLAEWIRIKFVADVLDAMEHQHLTRSDLALRLGKSKQYVGRILNETANFTVDTLAEVACALGMNLEINVTERVSGANRTQRSRSKRKVS